MNEAQYNEMTDAIRAIAHGTIGAPTGLELLALSMENSARTLANSIHAVADAIRETHR